MVHTKCLKKCDRTKEYVCPFHYEFLNDGVHVTFPVSVVFTVAARVKEQAETIGSISFEFSRRTTITILLSRVQDLLERNGFTWSGDKVKLFGRAKKQKTP